MHFCSRIHSILEGMSKLRKEDKMTGESSERCWFDQGERVFVLLAQYNTTVGVTFPVVAEVLAAAIVRSSLVWAG